MISKALSRPICNTKGENSKNIQKNKVPVSVGPPATPWGKRSKKHTKDMVPSVSVPRMSVRLVHSKVTKASGEDGKIN